MGEVYLPTRDSKEAYNAACNEEMLGSAARYAMELRTVEARRDFIATWPESRRNALKAKIKTLWEKRND
jgi:F420-dependent methylenetetrahydromethanopterin dehydrogenase